MAVRIFDSLELGFQWRLEMRLFCCKYSKVKKSEIKRDSLSTVDVKDWKLKSTSTICDECIGRCECLSLESTSQSKNPFKSQQDSSDSDDE